MIKLNPLATLSLRHLSPFRQRLLALASLLLVVAGLVATAALTGRSHSPAPQPVGQPPMQLASSVVHTSSAAVASRPRSSAAATPTRDMSATRPGPAPSMTSAVAAPPSMAPGHPQPVSSWPSLASPIHRVHASVTPAPSSRARPKPSSHPSPPPAPAAHLVGSGGLVGSVNTFRASNGASSLENSSQLTGDAESCALQMARNASVAHCGGNQVVAGAWSIGSCISLFESEPAHRDVLLNPAFSTAGSGVAQDAAGAYYCVVNFG